MLDSIRRRCLTRDAETQTPWDLTDYPVNFLIVSQTWEGMDSTGANRVYIHLREQHVAPGECGFRVHVTLWQQEENEGFPVAYRCGDGPTVVSALEAASLSLRDYATKQGIVDLWHSP